MIFIGAAFEVAERCAEGGGAVIDVPGAGEGPAQAAVRTINDIPAMAAAGRVAAYWARIIGVLVVGWRVTGLTMRGYS